MFSVWRDTKCVCVMSNEHPGHSETTVERNIRMGGMVKRMFNNLFLRLLYEWARAYEWCQLLRQTYQVLQCSSTEEKLGKPLAVDNSYIFCKELNPSKKQLISHFSFHETLVRELGNIEVTVHQSCLVESP